MGVCIGVDIQGMDEIPDEDLDGKGLADIIGELTSGDECISRVLARKYGFDVTPLMQVSRTDDPLGPWQDAMDLWRASYNLYQAFLKEGDELLGVVLFYRKMTKIDLDFYKNELKSVTRICKFAHENQKMVRLSFY
jgi:hypothetical protein